MENIQRQTLADDLHEVLHTIDCALEAQPGRVTLRRLNRAEYRRTILDLLGIDYRPAADFPADDVGYGFDNIADVLSLPPILLEKYLAAAEDISTTAIVEPAQGVNEDVLPEVHRRIVFVRPAGELTTPAAAPAHVTRHAKPTHSSTDLLLPSLSIRQWCR